MTNYGAIAILSALPERAPARQVRLLIAIETFRPDGDGWRRAGADLLARTANISLSTLKRARPELVDEKLIEYTAGRWRGQLSQYRLLIPQLERGPTAEPLKQEGDSDRKGSSHSPKGVQSHGQKGSKRKPDIPNDRAGQAADSWRKPAATALTAKAVALKAEGFSSGGVCDAAPGGASHTPEGEPVDAYGFPIRTKADTDLFNYSGIALQRAKQERWQWEEQTGDKDAAELREGQIRYFTSLPAFRQQPWLAMARRILRGDGDITQIAADLYKAAGGKDSVAKALSQLAETRAIRPVPPLVNHPPAERTAQ